MGSVFVVFIPISHFLISHSVSSPPAEGLWSGLPSDRAHRGEQVQHLRFSRVAQQEEAHVCGTQCQWQTNEREEDAQEKYSHSLPAHCGPAAMIGHIGHGTDVRGSGSTVLSDVFGVRAVPTLDRSDRESFHALRRKDLQEDKGRHLIKIGGLHATKTSLFFKERHYYVKEMTDMIGKRTMYILFSILNYKVHWHNRKYVKKLILCQSLIIYMWC